MTMVALRDGEATVKRLSKDGADTWLVPDNPAHEPICGSRAELLGKVTAVLRRL